MTYTESLKSGHIAVWDSVFGAVSLEEAFHHCKFMVHLNENSINKYIISSDVYAVNAINQMIDSARDL